MTDDLFVALESSMPVSPEVTDGIDGWLTSGEEAALFTLGRHASGSILEVGPWLGKSTACIAAGIASRDIPVPFTTVELNPTADQWTEVDELWHFYPDPDLPPLGATPKQEWRAIEKVVSHPLGVVGLLRRNLERVGVASLVDVVVGDFRQVSLHPPYGLLFSDTMHTPEEIDRYATDLRALLAEGSVFACHDMTPANREALGKAMSFHLEIQIDGLFVGRVA
jgi:hypothetical protein